MRPADARFALFATTLVCLALVPSRGLAWGDEGHEIVGQLATHYLQPAVRQRVFAMLAADTDRLTAHDFV